MHDTDTGTDKGDLVMLDVTPETTWKELFVHENNTRDNKRQGKSITSLASTVKSMFVKYGVSSPHDAQHMHASQLCDCIRYHHPDGETLHSGVMEALRLLGRHDVCKDLEGIFPTKRRWKKCVDPAATDGIRDDTNYNKSSECDDDDETVQPCCDTNIGVVECDDDDDDDDVTQYVLKQFVVGKHTLRFDVTRSADQEDALRLTATGLDELAARSDFVCVCVPLNADCVYRAGLFGNLGVHLLHALRCALILGLHRKPVLGHVAHSMRLR
jgi:hypothetical protein